jgi:hypothetical protein
MSVGGEANSSGGVAYLAVTGDCGGGECAAAGGDCCLAAAARTPAPPPPWNATSSLALHR